MTDLPDDALMVFREFRTAEMSTLGREGQPLTWPVFSFFRPDRGIFQVTTSIGLPQKAFNVRRNPRVAMLFSDPTGTGLLHPPAVLVQGDATCPDVIHTDVRGFEDDVRRGYRCQPKAKLYGADPISRRLVGWYFMRVLYQLAKPVLCQAELRPLDLSISSRDLAGPLGRCYLAQRSCGSRISDRQRMRGRPKPTKRWLFLGWVSRPVVAPVTAGRFGHVDLT